MDTKNERRPPVHSFSDNKLHLTLHVFSIIHGFDEFSAEAVFTALKRIKKIRGTYDLHVKEKIKGQPEYNDHIQVTGLDGKGSIEVSFQGLEDQCYTGCLSGRAGDYFVRIKGQALLDELLEVTGHSWCDPHNPALRPLKRRKVEEGLLPVGPVLDKALQEASKKPTAPEADVPVTAPVSPQSTLVKPIKPAVKRKPRKVNKPIVTPVDQVPAVGRTPTLMEEMAAMLKALKASGNLAALQKEVASRTKKSGKH